MALSESVNEGIGAKLQHQITSVYHSVVQRPQWVRKFCMMRFLFIENGRELFADAFIDVWVERLENVDCFLLRISFYCDTCARSAL